MENERKIGRPEKARSDKKCKFLSIRLSRPEFSAIRARANKKGVKLSSFVRDRLSPDLRYYY